MNSHRSNLALVLVLLAWGALVATGCPDSTTQSVTIVSPANESIFTVDDDISDAISGVQIDVTVRLTGFSSGATVDLRVNDESVGGLTYRGGDVVFSEVTIDPGENVLRAVAGSVSAQVTVTLEGGGCPTLQFLRPTASARINGTDDADGNAANGFQYDVRLSTDAPAGSTVALFVAGEAVGTATVAAGAVEFTAATLLATMPAAGAAVNVTLRAQTSATCTATITVQVLGPAVPCASFTFVDPTDGEVFGLGDDENADPTDGFQKTITISTDAVVGTGVELLVNGGAVATTTTTGTVLRFDSVDLPEGALVLRIQYEDDAACGAEIGVTVDTGAPTCDITAPLGDYLNAASDSDTTAPGLQTDFDVSSDAEAGQPVRLIIDGVETGAPTTNIVAGHALFSDIGLTEGAHTVRARCENAVGNVGFSATFSYTVDTVIPTCAITDPADGTWFNDGDDALAGVLGTQVEIDVQVTDAPTATTVAQCGFAPLDPEGTVTPGVTGAGSGHVTLTGPGNAICCAVQDAAGNAGEGRITLSLDTEIPQLEIRRPDVATTLILAVDDEGTSDTFCQYTVTVGCSNVGQPVTLSINTMDHTRVETCAASADALGGTATWSSITLPQGSVTLQARGESIGGLLGTSPDKTVTVDTELPVLSMLNPACGTVLTPADDRDSNPSNGIQYRIVVLATEAPVTLTVSDAAGVGIAGSPYAVTALSGAWAIFDTVTIVPSGSSGGTAYLSASATDVHGQTGTSVPSPCSIEVRDVPRVSITSPADGSLLGPSSDCNAGTPGFDLSVTVSSNVTSGTAELFVGAASAGTQPYLGVPLTFCVPASDGASILIRAEVTDARGIGTADIHVTIDSSPPDEAVDDLVLAVSNRRRGGVTLSWTAPADAGGGSVAGYQVRCLSSSTAVATFDWATATSYSFSGSVSAPGGAQTHVISGLQIERYITCMVRATDGVGSLGPLGNTPQTHLAFLRGEVLGVVGTTYRFGREIEAVGDVNDDGNDDFVVGTAAGTTLYLFFGSATTVPVAWGTTIVGPAGSGFGLAAAGIGDFNGDGIDDLLVGAYGADASKGRAYLFLGRTTWSASMDVSAADLTFIMDDPSSTRDDAAWLGIEVAAAGDADGDTLADVLVSASSWDASRGAVLLYYGRSTVPVTVTVPGGPATDFAGDIWFVAPGTLEGFGTSVAAGYRLNADAFDDVVIGAPATSLATGGKVYVSRGGARRAASGLVTVNTFDQELLSPVAATSVSFGFRVSTALLDAGTSPDLLVYMDYPPAGTVNDQGAVLAFMNSGGSFTSYSGVLRNDLTPQTTDRLGYYLGTALFGGSGGLSDLSGDGRTDVLVGMNKSGGLGGAGLCYLNRDWSSALTETSNDVSVPAEVGDTSSVGVVGYIGDVNGDSAPDWAVGHHRHSADRGRITIMY